LKLVKKSFRTLEFAQKESYGSWNCQLIANTINQMGVVVPNEIETPKTFKHFVFLEKKNP
jgi:hypothetical protein